MTSLLDTIRQPQDLRKLTTSQMEKLAGEIRGLLVHTVAHNGGHLAPNLGAVELTLAIHRTFDSPRDKIVWDVGHQAYVHKILTGRAENFATLRQYQGLCGFPRRDESEHDAFGVGHSSTSISAALGMAIARDLSGGNHRVMAVIGDGSLTGGQAFEALNQAGHIGTRLTVVLNDNEMSIAKNVGALSQYLARMRTAPTYSRVKREIEFLLRNIPAIGDRVARSVERIKDSLKYLIVPGILFEELGFTYIGPIDGHDIAGLVDVLQQTKGLDGPVLVHVITTKGRGYLPAERNPDKFHGVGPFDVNTGEIAKSDGAPSYTKVFGDTMVELGRRMPNLIGITAAMPEGTGLKAFGEKYPRRFFDVGIAEQHAVTMAAGMATQGLRPVVAIYSTFVQRAYDQVLHDVCLQNLPVVLAIDRAGIVGEDGATHQGVFDCSYLRHIPNLTVMAPRDENELQHMLHTAVTQDSGPMAIRYPRGAGIGVPLDSEFRAIPIGTGEQLYPGRDLVILALGDMVHPCLKARSILAEKGVDAGVADARFVKPLDGDLIRRIARETGIIVTVEDNVLAGGFGSAVLEFINANQLNWVKVLRLGLPDHFIEHGGRNQLLDNCGLSPEKLAEQILAFKHGFGAK